MRKLNELTSDEFFDVIYALSPALPIITEMEIIQIKLFDKYSDEILEKRKIIAENKALLEKGGDHRKDEKYNAEIEKAHKYIEAEVTNIFARDISKIIPLLTSRENRGCVFEVVAIVDGVPVADVKKYPPAKTATKIKQIMGDADFKDFLNYAESSDIVE